MILRTMRVRYGKAGKITLLMAVLMFWTTVAIAGVNEDLVEASKRGDLPEVKRLLDKGADVNAKDKFGRTALMFSSKGGHQEIQEMLIKAGAKKTWGPWLPFWWRFFAPQLTLNMVIVSLVILLVGGLWLWKNWRAYGSEPDVGILPDYLSSPPSDLPPAMVFLVRKSWLNKDADPHLIMVTLIDLAQKGFLGIEATEELIEFFEFDFVEYRRKEDLLIRKGKGEPKYEFEKLLINELAGHKLFERQGHIAKLLPQFKKSLERESVAMGFFDKEPTESQKWVRIPSLVMFYSTFAAFGLGVTALYGWAIILPLATLGIIGFLAAFVVAPKMSKKTWQGVREAALWDAFRNHLREVSQQMDMARDYLSVWDSYLPYAILFGLETVWINHFVEMHAPVPLWFQVAAGSYGQAKDSDELPLTLDRVSNAFTGTCRFISNTVASATKANEFKWFPR
jgi:hypothetical protein